MNLNKTSISIVIPALNEEESISELIQKIEAVCTKNNNTYEIIFVDDGSTDNTVSIIEEHRKKNTRIKLISFRRNFGKSAALACGFKYAKGAIIITMDADLQDEPKEINKLIKKLDEGYDLVSGWKKKRNDPLNKIIPSKIFNIITSKLSGIRLHDFNCGLKAYRASVIQQLNVYGEMHRFLPVLAYWKGFRVSEIPVKHHARKFGISKFGARRFFSGFFDLLTVLFLTKYKRKPLHIFGFFGLACLTLGTLSLLYLLSIKFMGYGIGNRPLLLLGILFVIIGIQFIGIGLLGELIINSHQEHDKYNIHKKEGFHE